MANSINISLEKSIKHFKKMITPLNYKALYNELITPLNYKAFLKLQNFHGMPKLSKIWYQ